MYSRHSFRADWCNYNEGVFFVTICCANYLHLFGQIRNNEMKYTELGLIAQKLLENIPHHYPGVIILNKVIMPNHLHVVLGLPPQTLSRENMNIGCLKPPFYGDLFSDFYHNSMLARIIGNYKAAVMREYRGRALSRGATPIPRVWQRLYHEHIIRSQQAFENIMNYIDNNVANWKSDCFGTIH